MCLGAGEGGGEGEVEGDGEERERGGMLQVKEGGLDDAMALGW